MKNLARITHHADKVENGPKASDRRRLPICQHPDCRRRVMAMPDGAPTAAHCYQHGTDVERAQYHDAWESVAATTPPAFEPGMRVASTSMRLPHQAGTIRTHFGQVTRVSAGGRRVYVVWDGCTQEDEMYPQELEPERPCPHPASRRFAWHAYNHLTNKTDALCVICCDCGAVLKGGVDLAGEPTGGEGA